MMRTRQLFQAPHSISKFGIVLFISLCISLSTVFVLKRNKSYSQIRMLRLADEVEKEGTNFTNKNTIEKIYNTEYEFLTNITLLDYLGKWSNLSVKDNILKKRSGEAEIYFYKIKNKNYILDLSKDNTFQTIFRLKDDKYIDQYIRGNFTTVFPKNFSKVLEQADQDGKIVFETKNATLDFLICKFLSDHNNYTSNKTNIKITFYIKDKVLKNNFEGVFISKFSSVDIEISSDNFNATLKTQVYFSKENEKKVRNYSFTLTLIAFAEMFCILSLLIKVNENSQVGLNLDLVTIAVSLVYKSFICSAHFYLSIAATDDSFSYEYGMISVIYFFAFSGLELRLLFFSWKSRYTDLIFFNPTLFKKKLFLFYFVFYFTLFFSLLSIKTIITNTYLCYLLFSLTWVSQIVHSVRTGTRPPMSTVHIIISTLGRLFLPVYLKAYDGNLFELKPAYWKVFGIIIIVSIQVLILFIQKVFGAKAIIPRCWKKLPYNYYRDDIKVEEHISKNPDCVICLEDLKNESGDFELGLDNKEMKPQPKTFVGKIKKVYCLGVITEKIEKCFGQHSQKKKYMITPCDHVFHTVCLERWMEVKNECPYCKRKIPPLE